MKSRDEQIREAYESGLSLRDVADQFGLSCERVRQIVGNYVRTSQARILDGQLRSLRTPLHVKARD